MQARSNQLLAAALLLFGLFCFSSSADNLATGRSVQLDALDSSTGLLLLKEKTLYKLDLTKGTAVRVASSKVTWFAIDRRSQTALVATRAEGGTDLTLYHVSGGGLKPAANAFIRLAVAELQSMKSPGAGTYLFSGCGCTTKPVENEIPFWVHMAINCPAEKLLWREPIPGLSEISDMLAVGTIGFAGDDHATYAYSAWASASSLLVARETAKLPPSRTGPVYLFLVVADGKVKYAWPLSAPSGGHTLAFTPDGRTLLARVNLGAEMFGPHDSGYKVIDLTSGAMTPWPLGEPYQVLAVDDTLKRAVIQSQYAIPPAGTPADAPLKKPESFHQGDKWRWRAEFIQQGKPPLKIFEVDAGDIDIAGTFIDGKFFATDGNTLGRIDESGRAKNIPIKLSE